MVNVEISFGPTTCNQAQKLKVNVNQPIGYQLLGEYMCARAFDRSVSFSFSLGFYHYTFFCLFFSISNYLFLVRPLSTTLLLFLDEFIRIFCRNSNISVSYKWIKSCRQFHTTRNIWKLFHRLYVPNNGRIMNTS